MRISTILEMRELIKYTKSENIKRKENFAIWQLFLHGPLFELSRGSASAQLKQRSMQEKLPKNPIQHCELHRMC